MSDERRECIDGLRKLADWLEANEGAPVPDDIDANVYRVRGKMAATSIARLPGVWEKDYGTGVFRLIQNFGPVRYRAVFNRDEVCRRKVTKRTVTREVPDPEVIEKATLEAPLVEQETEVEDVEWICDEPLLAGKE